MFEIVGQSKKARAGVLRTSHGDVLTPVFMPVGTQASVKGMECDQLLKADVPMLLANCYHLMLTPSAPLIEAMGGLHQFMNWHRPILTDSGGFQVWSLSAINKIDDEGVTFRSHRDGSSMRLTPADVITAQSQLGVDIAMVLDECSRWEASHTDAERALERTHRWAELSLQAFNKKRREGYGIFAILQGGCHEDLRLRSAQTLTRMTGFDGYAIGGLSVGESKEDMLGMIEFLTPHLPAHKPRYLMGVGRPLDILESVAQGIDMFDCVLPTRSGRNGKAFTHQGELNLHNQCHRQDMGPLDKECACHVCAHYTRGYVHHLCRVKEMLGATLLTWHNISFYQQFMQKMRRAIMDNQFHNFYTLWKEQLTR